MNENFYLCIFQTKNKAMQLYYALEEKGFEVFRLVSAPCGLRSGCNYAIRFKNKAYLDIIKRESEYMDMELPFIYYAERNYGGYRYKKINFN